MKIPELGPHYKELWAQEDQADVHHNHQAPKPERAESYSGSRASARNANARIRHGFQGDHDGEDDDKWGLHTGNIPAPTGRTNIPSRMSQDDKEKSSLRCGDITSRILSALIEDQLLPAGYLSPIG